MGSPIFRPGTAGGGGGGTTDHSLLTNRDAASQHPGTSLALDTTNFNKNLGTTDTTVQHAMETIDELSTGGTFLGLPDVNIAALTDGAILVCDGTDVVKVDPSTDGLYLKTKGAGNLPEWADPLNGLSAVQYKGAIDCSGNPNYPAADAGHMYRVSVAGKIGGASGLTVGAGYYIICHVNSSPSGDQATVGANWDLMVNNEEGEIFGPASSTVDHIMLFNNTVGTLAKDSGIIISDVVLKTRTINGYDLSANRVIGPDDILVPEIGTATIDSITEYLNVTGFTGRIYGGAITDGGSGNASVAAGYGLIRTTNSDIGVIKSFNWAANTALALTDNAINYICVSYNAGSPIIVVFTDRNSITWTDIFPLGRVWRSGTTLSIINTGIDISNFAAKVHDREILLDGFDRVSGAVVSSPTGLKIATTLGKFYLGMSVLNTAAKNTNVSDTFTYWYRNGSGGWTSVGGNTNIAPDQYDDGDGTIGTVGTAKYSIHFVYVGYDGSLHVQYGQSGTYTLGDAQAASVPTPPPILASFSVLAAKIIVLKGATSVYQIQSVWDTVFSSSTASDHALLANLAYADAGHTGFMQAIHDLTAETSIADSDEVGIWDASASAYRKMTKADFVAGISGSYTTWQQITAFTATPASTSTITMTSDLTATVKAGYGIYYTIGGTTYYGVINAITSGLMSIRGPSLTGDITALYYTAEAGRVVQMPIFIPGYYEDGTSFALLQSDLGQMLAWKQSKAYLVTIDAESRIVDSSSNGKINIVRCLGGIGSTNIAQAGAATSITLSTMASASDDFYNNYYITIVEGTGAGQIRQITDYVGSTKVATVATWTTNPDTTSVYKILMADPSSTGGVCNTSGGITLSSPFTWTKTDTNINTTEYAFDRGTEIEVCAIKGTGGTAQDLSLLLTFVVA